MGTKYRYDREDAPTIHLSQAVTHDKSRTTVEIQVLDQGDWEYFTAESVRDPKDEWDADLGFDFAFWRAVENAAKCNLRRLNGEVKNRDDIRQLKAEQKNRPTRKERERNKKLAKGGKVAPVKKGDRVRVLSDSLGRSDRVGTVGTVTQEPFSDGSFNVGIPSHPYYVACHSYKDVVHV